jgi:hypothetical protein
MAPTLLTMPNLTDGCAPTAFIEGFRLYLGGVPAAVPDARTSR